MFYSYKSFEQTKLDLESATFDILIFGFNEKTPYFLSHKYYKILNYLEKLSKDKNVDVIFVFYVKKDFRNLVNGLYISNGEVKRIFGEAFSKKCCLIERKNMFVQIMFYYDLYAKRVVYNTNDIELFVGLDNFGVDNIKYLQHKFLNRLVVLDGEGQIYYQKNVENITQKLCKYYIQI